MAQPLYVSDFQSFAWCYLALAQHKSKLVADAEESFRRAREVWEARKDRSGPMFDSIAMNEAGRVFDK